MYKFIIRVLMVTAFAFVSSCLAGCSIKAGNDGFTVKSFPAGAWGFGFQSPNYSFDAELDVEQTAKEIVKGTKNVIDEIMGLPILSMINGFFEDVGGEVIVPAAEG